MMAFNKPGWENEPDEEIRRRRLYGTPPLDDRGGLHDQGDRGGGSAHAIAGRHTAAAAAAVRLHFERIPLLRSPVGGGIDAGDTMRAVHGAAARPC